MAPSPQFGHRFIVEPSGPVLLAKEKKLLAELKPAGVMLRKRNFVEGEPYEKWLAAYRALVEDLRKAAGGDRLILSIDHEGGRVVRPPEPITRFPYAARWADRSREVAEAMAAELRSLAINTVFGPVADIHSNPANPVINQRAFGRTPEEVLSGAIPYIEVMEAEGILPCPKHFPGHGDTHIDSARDVCGARRAGRPSRHDLPRRFSQGRRHAFGHDLENISQ
jgi:beta-N-acetylhexosaminidase